MKAIVLDPHKHRQHAVLEMLAKRGHACSTAESVEALIAARKSESHHLIFVAAEIVRREGLPLSQQLRLPGEEGSCIILALEDMNSGNPQQLLAAGVDDVLVGPLMPEMLALRMSIAEHRLRRGLRRERWFEALIALGTTVYTVTDIRGTILYISPSLNNASEVGAENMVGRSVFDLVVPDDAEKARAVFSEVAARPGATAHARLRWQGGNAIANVVEASIRNCLDDPLIGGLIMTSLDVTRQQAIESALKKSESRYRTLVETMREGIAICSADETLTFVNQAFAALLGYERNELEGMNLRELTDAAQFARFQQETIRRMAGAASRYEMQLSTKQGDTRIHSVSATPLFDDNGVFVGTLGVTTDITERRREAERLRKSEERYRLIAENVSDVIWTRHLPEPIALPATRDGTESEAFVSRVFDNLAGTYVSPSVTRMLGYSVAEALGLSVREALTEHSYTDLVKLAAKELLQMKGFPPPAVTHELEYRTKDGGTRTGEITGNFFWDQEGRIAGSLSVVRDITERKQVEVALLDSEHRLRRLIENMPDFVILVDESAHVRYVNRGVGGLQPDQLVDRLGFGFLEEAYHPNCHAAFAAALETGEVQYVEARDIFGLWWSCRLVPLKEKRIATQVMIICSDVTEERRANEAVRNEQDLLRQLIELHERDRKVLAFELHDGFAQQLTGAMMSLEAAARMMASAPEKAAEPMGQAMHLLRESIEESRRLVSGLRPPVLDEFGIVAAVEHLVGLNHCGDQLDIELVSRGRSKRLAAPLENAVFRIVQESLTNIRRHSQSHKAVVELRLEEQNIRIEVRDWGVGFDPDEISEMCFGLRGIRERARLLGGQTEITSAPGDGTIVRVTLPMIEPAAVELPRDAPWDSL